METPSEEPRGGETSRALSEWAESIEKSFNEISQSLTDPQTAAAYLRSLDVVERLLQGSHATGTITDDQLAKLVAAIGGMRQAPRLI